MQVKSCVVFHVYIAVQLILLTEQLPSVQWKACPNTFLCMEDPALPTLLNHHLSVHRSAKIKTTDSPPVKQINSILYIAKMAFTWMLL